MVQTNSAGNAPWTAKGQEKRLAVQEMFSDIAPTYDRCNGLMSLSLHHRWRRIAVSHLQLQPGDSALDLCTGTGDFLRPLWRAVGPSGRLVGIDFCLPMLALAKEKRAGSLALGDAQGLPLASGGFEGVTVGWGIRNVPDVDATHREIARVLKPGGRFVSLDMARPRNRIVREISGLVMRVALPILGSLFKQRRAYTYLPKSTELFLTRDELKASMERAGFEHVQYRDLFFGNICMHWGSKG